ncbi:EF-hand domain-containing protein [Caballeronia sp. SEWSISQ10-4 2]|uniref:EF-hand domain-containing protein n=1 Tax=Caballeronia sp. SEWSISQ10-4 2 TaxID=2937438 RepID=UPI002653D8C6|nr:EF-hand domain-containing protein [Caballeronia sp. SEWSISQ10-4 2]MDN7180034.1 EF-hand domain-containing protein [Caballeronia sp. SEWSISQ10-4 2]
MKKALSILVLSIAVSLGSTAAMAQTTPQPMASSQRMERAMQQLQARFAAANSTHDGKLTKAQAAQGMPMVAQNFDQIDAQKAGYITLPQIEQFMQQRATSH